MQRVEERGMLIKSRGQIAEGGRERGMLIKSRGQIVEGGRERGMLITVFTHLFSPFVYKFSISS